MRTETIEIDGVNYVLRALSYYERIVCAQEMLEICVVKTEPMTVDVNLLEPKVLENLQNIVIRLTREEIEKEQELAKKGVVDFARHI